MAKNKKAKRRRETVSGMASPADWGDEDGGNKVIIITDEDDEYVVQTVEDDLDLMSFVDCIIEVSGIVARPELPGGRIAGKEIDVGRVFWIPLTQVVDERA